MVDGSPSGGWTEGELDRWTISAADDLCDYCEGEVTQPTIEGLQRALEFLNKRDSYRMLQLNVIYHVSCGELKEAEQEFKKLLEVYGR